MVILGQLHQIYAMTWWWSQQCSAGEDDGSRNGLVVVGFGDSKVMGEKWDALSLSYPANSPQQARQLYNKYDIKSTFG